jgi:molecular chaperone DnaK (HSP70)
MYDVVVGIDFGSSGTGYAYSFNNPEDIILGYFEGQGADVKVPTEIILDKNLNFKAFGEKCKEYINNNQLNKGELYFQRIKMSLYDNKTTIMPQNKSKEYNLDTIISEVLKHIKEEAIKKIKENRSTINENRIKWFVTVPAIWNEKQKGIMIKESEKAGLFNQCTLWLI